MQSRSILAFAVLACGTAWAQGSSPREIPTPERTPPQLSRAVIAVDTPLTVPGEITIEQDERISKLMGQYTAHKHPLKGFRVQIFLGSDRDKAREMRRSFLVKHPEVGGYESYLAPNFRIRVGDLRTRLEAEKLRDELKTEYPGCYIVPDEIELPRIPEVK